MVLYLFICSISEFELLKKMLHTNVWLTFPFVCSIFPIYMYNVYVNIDRKYKIPLDSPNAH